MSNLSEEPREESGVTMPTYTIDKLRDIVARVHCAMNDSRMMYRFVSLQSMLGCFASSAILTMHREQMIDLPICFLVCVLNSTVFFSRFYNLFERKLSSSYEIERSVRECLAALLSDEMASRPLEVRAILQEYQDVWDFLSTHHI